MFASSKQKEGGTGGQAIRLSKSQGAGLRAPWAENTFLYLGTSV